MAELPAEGKLHPVTNEEAQAVITFCENAIPHNEMIGRVLRNLFGRVQQLEKWKADMDAKEAAKKKKAGSG